MKVSISWLEQIVEILAEEIKEKLAEKQGINQLEEMMRGLVKEAAGAGLRKAIQAWNKSCYSPPSSATPGWSTRTTSP